MACHFSGSIHLLHQYKLMKHCKGIRELFPVNNLYQKGRKTFQDEQDSAIITYSYISSLSQISNFKLYFFILQGKNTADSEFIVNKFVLKSLPCSVILG